MPTLKISQSGQHFQDHAKQYIINMTSDARKLHRKNGCHFAAWFYKYYDFDSIVEAEASGVAYTKCELCFPQEEAMK